MKKSELKEGLIVAERRDICVSLAGEHPARGFRILSTEDNWAQYTGGWGKTPPPTQCNGARGVKVQRVQFRDGEWVENDWGLDAEVATLQTLITFEEFERKCQELKEEYDRKNSAREKELASNHALEDRAKKLGYEVRIYDGQVRMYGSGLKGLLTELEELRAFKASHLGER